MGMPVHSGKLKLDVILIMFDACGSDQDPRSERTGIASVHHRTVKEFLVIDLGGNL